MHSEESSFEEPLVKLRQKIEELSALPDDAAHRREIDRLREKLDRLTREVYEALTPWQKTVVARHPLRPYALDYVQALTTDFVELHGDRKFWDDAAVVAGFARFRGVAVAVIGHQKGRDTKEKIRRNFGMPRPEGFRKALRVMQLAGKFHRPILSFVDTAGAYPGIDAEERGQAEAIAVNLREMASLDVPIVVTITGEGGSGGALALAIGDRVLMLEHSVYSVITPEGCAAILWKDASRKKEAAMALKLTAADLKSLDVIDEIIPEPPGGAHSDPAGATAAVGEAIERHLRPLLALTPAERREGRYRKFRALGRFETASDW
ncbi:MAG: acetyl-CoA carboxylase carboxyltransferase subunit alpha [Acidobacteriota bacterium]|nr:acetyl-CoA carboxylase carboxyltransferase subunit alpha [Acidobacteriota bacterium]MDQ2980535.1 acetyl-CoA carboxylase carboxyltransferase subunit alpha [Acidobacteriota bacterium]